MKNQVPQWKIPKNLTKVIAKEESWEDDRWEPILLSVIGGTTYRGRDIPMAWQIEFEPFGEEFDAANQSIAAKGVEPDGYAWSDAITARMTEEHPELAKQLHTGDTESGTCVIWVESEAACKALVRVAWDLIHGVNDS